MDAYLNGRFVNKDHPQILLEDRGLTFGDGLYEILRTVNGRVLFFHAHLDRMEQSAGALGLPFPFAQGELMASALELIQRNEVEDGELYIQLTRGADPHREHVRPPSDVPPTLYMLAFPLRDIPRENWIQGAEVHTFPDLRHGLCEHKTLNLLGNVLAKTHASDRGGYEALMLRNVGGRILVTEGGSSSYFFIRNGAIATPEIDNILPGITRRKVISLAREAGLPVEERPVPLSDALGSDEVFLVSTVSKVMPVQSIDDTRFPAPGPLTRRLMEMFEALFQSELGAGPKN